MSAKIANSHSYLRQRIAQISARMMVEESIDDYYLAKCKAVEQLGIGVRNVPYPSNSEIEAEILLYQRLFYTEVDLQKLRQLRQTALKAMHLLRDFNPRLVGPVLQGTTHRYSEITLHLFAPTAEEVAFFLMEQHIPYELGERRFRLPEPINYPSYQFIAGETPIVLVVFSTDDIRWSPPSPVDGKPMRRADARTVEQLL
ncbi:MAG: hypothetical protein BWK79_02600 [Beggiatoa sp. IS2]|nr:MAG: hypothetical protein BWK79_02600 [Beggiatoa sp. IS2]